MLFLHDPADDSASDCWGFWPDRFCQRGYRVLTIDFPDSNLAALEGVLTATMRFLAATGSERTMIVAAGGACEIACDDPVQALVWLAPSPGLVTPALIRATPKLIVGGSAGSEVLNGLKELVRNSRGWTLLSTFAVRNDAATMLASVHRTRIESQIASFLHEFGAMPLPQGSRIAKRNPK